MTTHEKHMAQLRYLYVSSVDDRGIDHPATLALDYATSRLPSLEASLAEATRQLSAYANALGRIEGVLGIVGKQDEERVGDRAVAAVELLRAKARCWDAYHGPHAQSCECVSGYRCRHCTERWDAREALRKVAEASDGE